ncbi:hypothetical protein R1sor_005427 [Riccia sorocarpa]|uniref:Uncharacterized protein n=1 Tax=Riccia sorocarpa TaxID=122646 RepID=A0ABD3HLS4_9MARC
MHVYMLFIIYLEEGFVILDGKQVSLPQYAVWVKLLQKPVFGSLMKVGKPTAKRRLDILAMTWRSELKQFFLKMFSRLKLLLVTPLEALEVLEKPACTPDSADQVISCPGFVEGLGRILACRDVEPVVLSQAVRCLQTLSSFCRTRSKILSTCPGLFQPLIQVIREVCEPTVLKAAAVSVAKMISDEPYFKLHDSRDLLSVVVESIELPPTKDLKISVGSHVLEFVYTLTSFEAVSA